MNPATFPENAPKVVAAVEVVAEAVDLEADALLCSASTAVVRDTALLNAQKDARAVAAMAVADMVVAVDMEVEEVADSAVAVAVAAEAETATTVANLVTWLVIAVTKGRTTGDLVADVRTTALATNVSSPATSRAIAQWIRLFEVDRSTMASSQGI